MNSHLVSRLLRRKHLALVLTAFSLCGTTVRCLAATPTLSLAPTSWTRVLVQQGASATLAFNVAGAGSFKGNVTLTTAGLPSGVTASWSQNPISLSSEAGAATLKLTATAKAAVASTTFTVTASGDGVSVYHDYIVQVQPAPGVQLTASHQSLSMSSMSTDTVVLTATPVGGATVVSSTHPAVVSGLPSGIAASWSNAKLTAAGAASWTLTLTGGVDAAASSGTLNLSAESTDASGATHTATLGIPLTVTLNAPTLKFSPAATHLPVKQGAAVSDLFTFTGGGSFNGNVALTVSGLPESVAYSWSNPVALSANSGTSTLTLAPSAATAANWYAFTVTASGDGLSVSRNYTVEVEPAAGVQVQLSSSAATIEPQQTATISVTAKPINGIALPAGAVGASAAIASKLPAGVTASWSSPAAAAAGAVSWTLTLSADGTTQPGDSAVNLSVQITDANTGLVYAASPSFTLLTSLLAKVNVGTTPGVKIPANFMGLSDEWGESRIQMGYSAVGVNMAYRQLLNNLTAYGSGPMNLRMGGESTDSPVAPTPTTVEPLVELSNAIGAQFELGVDLGSHNLQLAVEQATDYVNQMPAGSVLGLEIGNEPDLFVKNGFRPNGYSFEDYMGELDTWLENITPVSNGVKLAGPDATGYLFGTGQAAYLANVQTYLAARSSALGMFTQHYYSASPADNPAPDFLLTPAAATYGPSYFAPAVQAVHAYGIPFRMGELGALSDGAGQGVSNTFASALFAVDTMFNYASIGVDGVDWEASGCNFNDPFCFTTTTSHGKATYVLKSVSPIYYGLLFFQAALGDGAQLLPVNLATPANLTAWATEPASGSPRVAIINKDETQSGIVSITMPGYSQATVLRLSAPSYTSTNGVTFAGQTMDGSVDGTLQGNHAGQTIEAGPDGSFQVSMPVTSAALVVFSN